MQTVFVAHALCVHVGALASIGSATQAPAEEHTGVEPEQLLQAMPPVPHVPADWPPTHVPLLQQPPHVDVEHGGGPDSTAASCAVPPASCGVVPTSGLSFVASSGWPPSSSSPPAPSSPAGASSPWTSVATASSVRSSPPPPSFPVRTVAPSSSPVAPTDPSPVPSAYAPTPVIAPQAATPSASKVAETRNARIHQR